MTLILHTVVIVSVLLVSTTATPPSGYAKQPDNDKNPPSYRYKYKIEDDSGEVQQAKTEARTGEHASGRYYVNSKQASTDVKYYADDWGYHPLVKYSSSDDHSSSSARLAFGEQAVKNYDSDNGTPSMIELPRLKERKKLVQVTPAYQQDIVYSDDTSNADHQSSNNSFGSVAAQQSDSTNSVNVNYVTNAPTQPILETVSSSSSSTSDAFPSTGHQSSSTTTTQARYYQQQSNLLTSQENDLSSSLSVSEEDQLFVENAGSFGARVQPDTSYLSPTVSSIHSSSSSSSSSGSSSNADDTLSSVTRDARYYHGRLHYENSKQIPTSYLPSALPGLSYFASTALPPLDNSVTANSIENNVAGFEGSFNKYEFSKPIVVAEPSQPYKEPPFQYSTTFECEDDKSPPTTANPLLYKDDTASSHVLNSIQAGVVLGNAGEAHLIGRAEEARSPAPVEEKIDDFDQPAQLTQHHNVVALQTQAQAQKYVAANPAFSGQENSLEPKYTQQPQTTTQPQPQTPAQPRQQDESVVEIQKSIEIYHSSPQHEIHYPGTLPTQVTEIHQRQPQYFSSNADENNKQSRGDVNYEITGTYSKVAGGHEPLYVVPPATYIVDNDSAQKNHLQQDKSQRYQENSQLIQLNEQQHDAYNSEIGHQDQLQTIPPKQEQYFKDDQTFVTQGIPYPVENVVEQKIPVPQPYAITVEVPVPQPYPVHIEKVVEKKIPIPIPIPQPYPVEKIVEKVLEKKVPYPVEISKYIEKPFASQAPYYGQQHYGVSYQQVMKPQNHGLYSHQISNQYFQRHAYEKPIIPPTNVKANLEHNPFLKKHPYNSYLPPKSNSLIHRRHTAMQRPSDVLGPPPLQRQQQHTFQPKKSFASRSTPSSSLSLSSSSRRARNHDPSKHQKGNFRQSKIEYGFKPPMVPSIQYDEETASKVES